MSRNCPPEDDPPVVRTGQGDYVQDWPDLLPRRRRPPTEKPGISDGLFTLLTGIIMGILLSAAGIVIWNHLIT